MVKIFLALIFITCSVFSSVLQDGFNLYKNQNYIRAYEKFYTLHIKNTNNIAISIYMAKTLFHLGEYKRVKKILLPIYKKAKNEEASLYLAKIYFHEKNYTKSKDILLSIKPKDHQADITKLLEKIEKATKLHTFSFYLGLKLIHDNNIHNNTFAPSTWYNGIELNNDTKKVKDTFIDKILFVSHNYKFPSIKNTTWRDNFLLYDRSGIDYSSENFFFASLESGPVINKEGYIVKPQILLDDIFYESEHYRYSYGVGIAIDKDIKSSLKIGTKISYSKAKYIKDIDKTQNADTFKYLLYLKHNITETDTLNYRFIYEDTEKNKNGRYNISKNIYSYNIRYLKQLPKNYKLELKAQYDDYKYKDIDPDFGKRKDTRTTYRVKLSKKLKNSYNISLGYVHTYNNSNINLNSYKKETFNIMLSKYF